MSINVYKEVSEFFQLKSKVYILNKGKVVFFVDKDETREAKSFICC